MDGKVLAYYEGTFDSVYVLLHPFIRPIAISKELFNPSTYPERTSIVEGCKAVCWSEILDCLGLPSLAAVDVGLRTQIGGLKASVANDKFASAIDSLYDIHGVVPPDEGRFSDLLHDLVLQGFQNAGYQWVWVGDEMGTERKLHWIDDLKGSNQVITGGHCNVFSPDKKILWATHWDSHFSFLCGSHEILETLVQQMNFEGFFCDTNTEVYWSVRT